MAYQQLTILCQKNLLYFEQYYIFENKTSYFSAWSRQNYQKIPESLVIDLDGVDIGESFKISSIKLEQDVVPTIQGRDFVIATLAAPTVMKEPEKPAEAEAAEGAEGTEAAAAAEGGDKPAEGGDKPAEGDKKETAPAEKK